MANKTIEKYFNILSNAKASAKSLFEYCKENGVNYKTLIKSVKNLQSDNGGLADEVITLFSELNIKQNVSNSDNSELTYDIDESGKILGYNIVVYIRDNQPFKTYLTREDAETIFGLYTYYGGNITARNVANEFPKYTLPEIKKIFRAFSLTKDSSWAPPHLLRELSVEELSQYRMNLKERAAFKYADSVQEKDFKNTINKLAAKIKQLEDRNEFFKNIAISDQTFEQPKAFEINESETTGILFLSDIHVGAVNTTNGYLPLNDYNEQEINNRLDKVLERIVNRGWKNIIVINLGDSVDSYKGTTAKGTPLPTQYSEKEMTKMYLRIMNRFFSGLKQYYDNIQYICTGDSNHDGAFGWLNNVALSYQLENIGISCYISDNPIDTINVGEYSIVYLHGHDSKTQFKGFPLHLDPKCKDWFNNYFLQAPIEFKKNRIVVKGDLHQFSVDSCNTFDYINVPSIYGSSSWIVSNFGKGKQGCSYIEINNNNYNISTIWV